MPGMLPFRAKAAVAQGKLANIKSTFPGATSIAVISRSGHLGDSL
uniref:Uncharacterized protein n=1 Tax=Anguilla anguilla TaxID=7936 RepID=A0A0E9PJI9_ANGAN